MQRRFLTLLEIVTVGLPFSTFKILAGRMLLERQLVFLGGGLFALGVLDGVLNAVNFVSIAAKREHIAGVCTFHWLARTFGRSRAWEEVGLSADMMLSFGLVATVVGTAQLLRVDETTRILWSTGTVLNVLGAGSSRLVRSIEALGATREPTRGLKL